MADETLPELLAGMMKPSEYYGGPFDGKQFDECVAPVIYIVGEGIGGHVYHLMGVMPGTTRIRYWWGGLRK